MISLKSSKNYIRLMENIKLNNQIERCFPFLTGLHNSNKIEQLFISDERSSSSGHQIGNNVDENGLEFKALEKYPLITFSMDDFIKIFKLKRRPKNNPLIVHYYDISDLEKDCYLNKDFFKLFKKFCPGPITFILNLKKNLKFLKLPQTIK